ncbi:MAG: outer membrane receptor protein involved in Fe transport [Candidatus Azotimanducaceae bacterium]
MIRDDSVDESSIGAYAEVAFSPTEKLRGVLGLRVDRFDWEVKAQQPVNSGSGHDSLLSPRMAMAYQFSPHIEGYFNYGRGMHSNDVRGPTITVDPVSGASVENVDVLVPTEGSELGLRFERGAYINITVAIFWLELDSELVFAGDAGGTEPNDGSRRYGFELSGFWTPLDWLALNAA